MEAGLRGQGGDNVRDLAGQDYRHERGPVQTRHPAMAGKNARDPRNNTGIVYCSDVQVKFARKNI